MWKEPEFKPILLTIDQVGPCHPVCEWACKVGCQYGSAFEPEL